MEHYLISCCYKVIAIVVRNYFLIEPVWVSRDQVLFDEPSCDAQMWHVLNLITAISLGMFSLVL